MGEIWIPEAEDLKASGSSGTMSGRGGPRATLHCTVSRTTQFDDMDRVLTGGRKEPHLLYSFADDRLGQYFPLNRSGRALMGAPAVPLSHNKAGTVNIQIEVVATTDDWTRRSDWRPGPNFRAMMRAIRSWGIEDRLVYRFAQNGADRANVVRPRSWLTDPAHGGCWWGHCHYPSPEIHWDPGRVNMTRFFAAATNPLGSGGGPVSNPIPGASSGGVTFQEDDMPSPEDLVNADIIPDPDGSKTNPTWSMGTYFPATYRNARAAFRNTNEIKAELAALTAAVQALATAKGVDPTAIADEVAAAVKARLAQIVITDQETS